MKSQFSKVLLLLLNSILFFLLIIGVGTCSNRNQSTQNEKSRFIIHDSSVIYIDSCIVRVYSRY